MNRPMVAVLLLLLLTGSVSAQKKSDLEHDRLIGPVKILRVETAKLVSKSGIWLEKGRNLQWVIHYDPKGNMTKEVIHLDSPRRTEINYHYDKDGNRSESINMEGSLRPLTHRVYGVERRVNIGSGGGDQIRLVRRTFKHDADGRRVEEVIYGNNNDRSTTIYGGRAISGIYKFTYDPKGQMIEITYSEAGVVLNKWVNTYDDSGNVTEMAKYSEVGRLLLKESYKYEFDSTGNWIKRTTSKWKERGSKSYFEPEEVTYRAINYY